VGGLGLKDLGIQNTCLLLKMIHKLHSNNASSWVRWVHQNASIATLTGNLHGSHWDTLRSLLTLYRAITIVNLMDRTSTSFWHDVWDGHDSLAERFPELLSQCRNQNITVKQAYDGELNRSLTVRQSTQATVQLLQVVQIMEGHNLVDGKDQRRCQMTRKNGELDTAVLYRALKSAHGSPDAWATFGTTGLPRL
jgi:hypothetical protein